MKISPSAKQKKPGYPVLLTAAAVAAVSLTSCQQQQQQQHQQAPVQRPMVLGGSK